MNQFSEKVFSLKLQACIEKSENTLSLFLPENAWRSVFNAEFLH